MTEAWLPALLLLGFPPVFVAFWCAACWLISRFGWSQLAARSATPRPMPARGSSMVTGRVGLANYKGTLELAADAEALWLDVLVLFRPGHARLRVPWAELERLEGQGWSLFPVQRLRAAGVEISLPAGTWAELEEAGAGGR
jgi:hypothetical protein